jgi:N-acetylglutamate synthase-like GNAT family acetyltransferase
MKIRVATKFDIPEIFDMLRHYRDAGTIAGIDNIVDEDTPLKIMSYILAGAGLAIVCENEGHLSGMLLALKSPQLWDQSKFVMNEIVYWVEPHQRGSTAGYRLIDSYVKCCDDLKEQKQITNFTISQMNGQTLKYDRFGFKPIESTWSQ